MILGNIVKKSVRFSILFFLIWGTFLSRSNSAFAMDVSLQKDPNKMEEVKPLPSDISQLDKGAQLEIKEDMFLKKDEASALATKNLNKVEKNDVSCLIGKESDSDRVLVRDLGNWRLDFSQTSFSKEKSLIASTNSQVDLKFIKKNVDGYLTLSCTRRCLNNKNDCSIKTADVTRVLEANGLKINNIKIHRSIASLPEPEVIVETLPPEETSSDE